MPKPKPIRLTWMTGDQRESGWGFFATEDLVITAYHCGPREKDAEVTWRPVGDPEVTLKRAEVLSSDEIDVAMFELTETGRAALKRSGFAHSWYRCGAFTPSDPGRKEFWTDRTVFVESNVQPYTAELLVTE